MRKFKPLQLSVWFALIISVLATLVGALYVYTGEIGFYVILLVFPINFIIVFFSTSFFLTRFIEDRLKPLFKIIREIPIEETRKANLLKKTFDLTMDVNAEVTQWATHKQDEIKRLKELEQYRKEFVGNVSHELKTPIFNIQGYILTLLEGGLDDPRINKLYLERTVKSIDRIISVVEDLESINKLESGELKLRKESFDMVKLTEDVFEIEHMIAKDRKISLEFVKKYDKPVMVLADKKRLMELMGNLVVNAIKYGKRNGFVKVGFFDFDDHIVVEVSDNGIGIEKEHLHRIFERFYRIDKHRSREQGGTGLGLSIVKHIIEAHQQTINVKSQVDVGTIFNFTLEKGKN